MQSRGDDFKPIQAEFRLTAKAACDYTKWPEVKAALAVRRVWDRGWRDNSLEARTISRLPDMDGVKPFVIVPGRGERVMEGERERRRRFDALFEAHSSDVVAYCDWRAGSPGDAEEAVAEVFLTAWRRLDDVPRGDAARLRSRVESRRYWRLTSAGGLAGRCVGPSKPQLLLIAAIAERFRRPPQPSQVHTGPARDLDILPRPPRLPLR